MEYLHCIYVGKFRHLVRLSKHDLLFLLVATFVNRITVLSFSGLLNLQNAQNPEVLSNLLNCYNVEGLCKRRLLI